MAVAEVEEDLAEAVVSGVLYRPVFVANISAGGYGGGYGRGGFGGGQGYGGQQGYGRQCS